MMEVHEMRGVLIKQYPYSPDWKKRVKQMPDNQILAIYYRYCQNGTLRGKAPRNYISCAPPSDEGYWKSLFTSEPPPLARDQKELPKYKQLSLFND